MNSMNLKGSNSSCPQHALYLGVTTELGVTTVLGVTAVLGVTVVIGE